MSENIEQILWKRVKRYGNRLNAVPFVRMIAVCNNLAFGKVDENSDIDLFVIARAGRLFTVRFLITAILQLSAVRRHGKKIKGRFCLSFFVDDNFLDLSPIKIEEDIYLAYWTRNFVPLIDDGVSKEFVEANKWTEDYFENLEEFEIDRSRIFHQSVKMKIIQNVVKTILNGKFGDFFEKKLKNWQLKRARKKAKSANQGAGLLIGEHVLKFHNLDRRGYYKTEWSNKYGDRSRLAREKFLSIL